MRGDGLPEEKIRPWEMALHIVPNFITGLRTGFTWNWNNLFQNVFYVKKDQLTVGQVATSLADGFNDPIIGAYMDAKCYPIRTHRRIVRINAVAGGLTRLLPLFSFGMTAWQHIIFYIVINVVQNMIFGTPADVAGAKIFSHVSPHSAERGKLAAAAGFGRNIYDALAEVAFAIVGLREALGWSEYLIYVVGACIFTLPAIFADMGPSFVLQRVPDAAPPAERLDLWAFAREVKDCFVIVRHNRYLMLELAQKAVTVCTPGIADNDYYRYMGVDSIVKAGKLKSETILWLRDNVVSAPGTVLQPFSLPVIKKLGGPRNTQAVYQGIAVACYGLRAFAGMKTQGAVVFSWAMEMVIRTLAKVQKVAEDIIKYEMLDYIEWKTGRRSEGANFAIDGVIKKMVLNNVDTAVGNLVIHRLGFDPALGTNQPAAFRKYAPWLYLLVPVFDNFVILIARLLYKYPASLRDQVEADLIERRALAEQKKEELEVTPS